MTEEKMFMSLAFVSELCQILGVSWSRSLAQVYLFVPPTPKAVVENLQDFNSQHRWHSTVCEMEDNCLALWCLMKSPVGILYYLETSLCFDQPALTLTDKKGTLRADGPMSERLSINGYFKKVSSPHHTPSEKNKARKLTVKKEVRKFWSSYGSPGTPVI